MTETTETAPRPRRLPGDPTREQLVQRVLRVDHAGEYGAVRIYEGQLAVLGRRPAGAVIREMAAKEREHLATFDALLPKRRVRPSALQPVWHVAGFALGAATALLGAKAAMACTVAVEEVIDEHYARQVAELGDDEAELRDLCARYRQDEVEHGETALAHGAREAPGYKALTGAVKAGSRAAIWLAERI
ncbi:MAG TPA: demethoxyubiquinone hydroxylase family protein [Rhodospirillales bacterium]|nr:demethoxyubiquinone hydroxylase family protein [Rhodospirillales bacterium]